MKPLETKVLFATSGAQQQQQQEMEIRINTQQRARGGGVVVKSDAVKSDADYISNLEVFYFCR